MSESDPAIVGVESCGCVTYANAAPNRLDRDDEKVLASIVRNGGSVLRMTVAEVRALPHFLPPECPHEPKGWARKEPEDPAKRRTRLLSSRGVRIVYSREKPRLGEVRKRDGAWEATRGWFNYREPGANDGGEAHEIAQVYGPFQTMREAVDALPQTDHGEGA